MPVAFASGTCLAWRWIWRYGLTCPRVHAIRRWRIGNDLWERQALSGQQTQSPSLTALLGACANGDRAAFRELYTLAAPRLYGVALRITRDAALAADAVHDAFVQVWRQASRFDVSRGSPDAWLNSLVRYRALDIVRGRRREIAGYEPPDTADPSADALDRLVATAEGAALRGCLEQLEDQRRGLIVMAFVDGLSHSDLAAKLVMPLGTVKSLIRRGLAALKRCLEQ